MGSLSCLGLVPCRFAHCFACRQFISTLKVKNTKIWPSCTNASPISSKCEVLAWYLTWVHWVFQVFGAAVVNCLFVYFMSINLFFLFKRLCFWSYSCFFFTCYFSSYLHISFVKLQYFIFVFFSSQDYYLSFGSPQPSSLVVGLLCVFRTCAFIQCKMLSCYMLSPTIPSYYTSCGFSALIHFRSFLPATARCLP